MSTNAEIKRAILKGVLEDNLNLPNSSSRNRKVSQGRTIAPPRDARRNRWSPVPLLIAAFLLASGAAFPRLAGGPLVVGATAQDHERMDRWQPIEAVVRTGEIDASESLAVEEAPDDTEYQAEPIQSVASTERLPEPEPVISGQFGVAELIVGQSEAPVHTIYQQMIEDGSIPVADLFGLDVRTIVIDPGHGGVDPGATGPNGVMEKELTLDIARRVRDKLERAGNHRVLMTRDDDIKIALKDRVAFARKHTADLFISIHFNSLPVESDNLVETFYFGPQADKRILELAEKENADSGYAVADFRQVIERISDTLKTQESKDLAALLPRQLYTNLKRENRQLSNAGIKTAPFVVLLGSDVPSVLAEVSCLSNEREARNLETPEYRDKVAGYLRDGILEYLDQQRTTKQNHIAKGELKHVAKQQDR